MVIRIHFELNNHYVLPRDGYIIELNNHYVLPRDGYII